MTLPPGVTPIPSVVNMDVRLRAAPGLAATVLRILTKGEPVTVYAAPQTWADGFGWLRVDTPAGEQGYAVQYFAGRDVFLAATTPAPTHPPIIDVSEAQGVIDWPRFRAAGVTTAIIRATQGDAHSIPVGRDRRFSDNITGALAAGVQVSTYHAFLAAVDGSAQADFYADALAPYLSALALPVAVDVEIDNGKPPNVVADRLFALLTRLEQRLGYKARIYTSQGFWNGKVGTQHDDYFAQHDLWCANYTHAAKPVMPRLWSSYVLWQFSSTGHVDGIAKNVDLSRLP